jgi:hypothetical protein
MQEFPVRAHMRTQTHAHAHAHAHTQMHTVVAAPRRAIPGSLPKSAQPAGGTIPKFGICIPKFGMCIPKFGIPIARFGIECPNFGADSIKPTRREDELED